MAAVAGDSPEVNLRCEKQNIRIPQLDMELRELQTEPETDTEIRDKVSIFSPLVFLGCTMRRGGGGINGNGNVNRNFYLCSRC